MSSSQALRLRAFARAAELLGVEGLAEFLGISTTKVSFMLSGGAAVTEDVFLQTVDVLISRDIAQLSARVKAAGAASSHSAEEQPARLGDGARASSGGG